MRFAPEPDHPLNRAPASTAPWGLPPAQACRQCGRCASVCPRSRPPLLSPRRVVRLVQLGLVAEAARDPFLHACRFCGRCLVNCPHGVQVARLLHRLALARFFEGDPPA